MSSYPFVEILGGPGVIGKPPANDAQLLDLIFRGLPRRAFDQLVHRANLPLLVLAAAIGPPAPTGQDYAPEQRLAANASDQLVQLATLYAEGFNLFGEEKFRIWMASPILALGGRKPVEYIDSAVGIRLLRDIFGRIEHGVFS